MSEQKISDEQHAHRLPVPVTLAGQRLELEPLPFRQAMRWLAEAMETVKEHGMAVLLDNSLTAEQRLQEARRLEREELEKVLRFNAAALDRVFDFAGEAWNAELRKQIEERIENMEEVVTTFFLCVALANPTKTGTKAAAPPVGSKRAAGTKSGAKR